MESIIFEVNWLAICIGAVVAFGIGWLWYSDTLFGKKWREGANMPESDTSSMVPAMLAQSMGTFLFAWVIGVTVAVGDFYFAALVAIAFAALIKANGYFAKKSKFCITVDAGYILVMAITMILAHMVL